VFLEIVNLSISFVRYLNTNPCSKSVITTINNKGVRGNVCVPYQTIRFIFILYAFELVCGLNLELGVGPRGAQPQKVKVTHTYQEYTSVIVARLE
jgi:hypothetical protein